MLDKMLNMLDNGIIDINEYRIFMSLIKKPPTSDKVPLSIRIPKDVKEEVRAYCQWVGFKDYGHFYTEAARMVLSKDKAWQAEKKNQSV